MDLNEREQLKREAYELLTQSETVEGKAEAVEMIIRAHYDRSRSAYRGKHPDFTEYASHWVWAGEGQWPVTGAVRDYLIAKYPSPSRPRIKRGNSYWGSM